MFSTACLLKFKKKAFFITTPGVQVTFESVYIPPERDDGTVWALCHMDYFDEKEVIRYTHTDILVFNRAASTYKIFDVYRFEHLQQGGLPSDVSNMCAKFDRTGFN